MKIVKTTEARNKIKRWFRRNAARENIVNGKEDLDRELRANLLYNGFYENEEVQKNTLNKFSFNTVDELYAAIGYGGIMLTKVINKVKDDVGKLRRQRESRPSVPRIRRTSSSSAARINPATVLLSKALITVWSSLPAAVRRFRAMRIVGFVTRGYGVSIHRRDCGMSISRKNPTAGSVPGGMRI